MSCTLDTRVQLMKPNPLFKKSPSLPPPSLSPSSGCYLGIYAMLGLLQAFLVLFASFSLAMAAIFASRTLHDGMLKNILRSPMSFFDTTPLGRILNRFSKDIYTIDEAIPRSLRSFIWTGLGVISTLIVIVVATPIFSVVIVPLAVFYFLVQVGVVSGGWVWSRAVSVALACCLDPVLNTCKVVLNTCQ